MERLDKFLSARSGMSRKEAQKRIKNGEDLADPNSQLHIRLRELNIEFGRGGGWFGSGEGEDENDNPAYMVEAFREE